MAIAIILSNGRTWKTKAAALSHFKDMLARYADGKLVEDRNDHDDLVALLERYDEAITDEPSKTGTDIYRSLNARRYKECSNSVIIHALSCC